jgi:hypothetical protein
MHQDLPGPDDRLPYGQARITGGLFLLRDDDTLVVWKMDRLGRGVKGLVDIEADLEKKGVHFQSLTD